ncbi:MAG: hypothetical protein JNM56_35900 [Planctomycetia bacterium]|nr:hypothetical protein [Planctomycetia bacterium]
MLRYWPFLLPPLYLLLIFALQPADRLGDPAAPVGRLVYDDYDLTALVLRGLNAAHGRTPGHPHPDYVPGVVFRLLLEEKSELEPNYFLEYPPPALLIFRLAWPDAPAHVPPAVLDGLHNSIVEHYPRTDAERALWQRFRLAMRITQTLMMLSLLGLMAVLCVGYEPDAGLTGPVWLLVLPGALYFALNRFDVLPALLTALSFCCLGRQRIAASAAFLALGVLVKVYPVLLAPLVARYLLDRPRAVLTWIAVFGGVLLAGLLPPFLVWGWDATWSPIRFQMTRHLEMGWTVYGVILPTSWGHPTLWGRCLRLGSVVLVGLLLVWRRPHDLADLLGRSAVVLVVFVALQVFYSPQWILWLTPLLAPLCRNRPAVLGLTVALDLLTFTSFPLIYDLPGLSGEAAVRDVLRVVLVWGRVLLLTLLAGVLLWRISAKPPATSALLAG